jgi:flagellar hook-associated protein 2
MSTSGINFSGLGSGIDTESILKQLITLQQKPIQRMQERATTIRQQQAALGQFTAAVAGLQASAATLDTRTAFAQVVAESSDTAVAKAEVTSGAQTGDYTVTINQLAKAHRIASTAVISSQTEALGASGRIVVNGKTISVAATDSLQQIATSINSARAGVNAAIVNIGAGNYTLTLTSTATGANSTLQVADVEGGSVLRTSLGIIGTGTVIANPVTNGARSALFSDSATSIGTLLGQASAPSGTIQINGTNVSIDFAVDSLAGVASKINAAGITGVTASVVSTTDPVSGASRQRLEIVGTSTPTFTDSNNILTNLGVLRNTFSNQLVAGQDASFNVNGLSVTRSTNIVNDVINGVTLTLLKDTGTPIAGITVKTDVDSIKGQITGFVNAYNTVQATLSKLSSYDADTRVGGPLFGDFNTVAVLDGLTDILGGSVRGLPTGSMLSLAEIGITLSQTGQFQVDDSKLSNALTNSLSSVERLFRAFGTTSDTSVFYISSTEKTKASTSSGYAINITQLATKASVTGSTVRAADDNPLQETLTFTGPNLGGSGRTITIAPNSTLNGIVSLINSDEVLSTQMVAVNNGGRLEITSKQFGTTGNFTVVSNQAAATNNSGIGTAAVEAVGLNVAGTINGEPATGVGQFLTGNAGNATTDGLQLRVASASTGPKGSVVFTRGMAANVAYFAKGATDGLTGGLTLYNNSLSRQVEEQIQSITDLQTRLKEEEARLRERFTAMDAAVARIRQASAGLAGLTTSK